MAAQRPAAHRTILIVDVEGFGDQRRTNADRVAVRDGLYRALRQAFSGAAIPWDDSHHQDCGDGVLVLIPAQVPKGLLAESLPHALIDALDEHNRTHRAQERMRLRMALHAGEVNPDDHGFTSASINLAFRLLDAQPLKAALAESPGVLAVIVSAWFFDEVVRHSAASSPSMYRRFRVVAKETDTVGWVCLPDQPRPPGETGQGIPAGRPRYAGPGPSSVRAAHLAGDPVDAVGMPVVVPTGQLPAELRGRRQLLRELRQSLRRPPGEWVVLAGMGGAGKSTIAAAFAESVRQARTGWRRRHVWWASAADPASLASALVTMARQLGGARADIEAIGAGTTDAPDRLWALLRRAPRGWLLVFDNADDPSALARPARAAASAAAPADADTGSVADGTGWVRPTRRGLVVVTSRNASRAAWGRHARVLPVGPLEEDDAAQVLLDWAPQAGDDAAARTLARRLGCLPLALHLAGSYLESDVALRGSFRDYQRALDNEDVRPHLLTARPDIGSTVNARAVVMRTWEISLDALARNGVPQARPLLRLLSCYDPATPVPLGLLVPGLLSSLLGADGETGRALGANAEHRLEDGLHQLRLLGLIDVRPSSDSGPPERAVLIHPVIADTNRAHLGDGGVGAVDPTLVRRTAIELVVHAIGRLDPDVTADWPAYLRLGPHLHALFQTTARYVECQNLRDLVAVTTTTAEAHHRCGAIPAGEHLSRAALDVAVPLLGEDDPASLLARHLFAWPLAIQGRLGEAEAIYRSVVTGRRRVLGEEHPDTLWTRHEVAWIAACQGRWAEAETAYRDVLDARRRILGDEHPHTLMTRHGLAWTMALQGRHAAAIDEYQKLLDARRRNLGEDHPDTIATREALERLHRGQIASARHLA